MVAQLVEMLEAAVEEAVTQLDAMRGTEGDHLNADLEVRRALVGGMLEEIADAADQGRLELQARLAARVQELTVDIAADANLIAQEIVRVASRSDISEEMARFRAHLAHWKVAGGFARAVRPQARLSAAGNEPRSQHHRIESRRACASRTS